MVNQVEGQEIVEEVIKVEETPKEVTISEDKIKEIQNKAFGHILNQIDVKLAEAGYSKPAGVKTTDYILDVIKSKTVEPVSPKVDDQDSTTKIKALQEALRTKESELEQVKASTSLVKREFYLDNTLSNLAIDAPAHLTDVEKVRYVERAKSTIKRELESTYDLKEVNGQFKVYEKDGSPVLDGTIEMDSIKLDTLLKRDFSEFFAKVTPTPAPVKGTGGAETKVNSVEGVSIPSSIKSAGELHQYLTREKGLVMGQEEYNKVIISAREQRPSWFR